MKVVIGYPPLSSEKGSPLLSQNRQFQWFKIPTYIYPVVPAYAATMLKQAGYKVLWLDGIAERWSYQQWLSKLKAFQPDLLILETKTPVIKKHWQIINQLKSQPSQLKIVLVGDHVTALPKESFKNSLVDYVLTGGDYDWLALNLVNHLSKEQKLEPGIFYRQGKKIINTGRFRLNHNLNQLPLIDRQLTQWKLYAYENGNYKETPGTYIMAGRDCWWRKKGGCKFCSWTTLYPQWRVRKTSSVLEEIGELIEKYKVKEIMDDTGTFPAGQWLQEFCQGMIKRGYQKKTNFNCNLRFGVLKKKDYQLMARAGFRFLLFGLESASQKTLDCLNKGIQINKVKQELQLIKQVNKETNGRLEPHVTCMVGYPWETEKGAQKTIQLTKELFKRGLIDSLQATVVIPYPGTALFKEAQKQGWLTTKDWDDYDMNQPVMKTPMENKRLMKLTQGVYVSCLTPQFLFRKIVNLRSWQEFKFLLRTARKFIGHWWDFK